MTPRPIRSTPTASAALRFARDAEPPQYVVAELPTSPPRLHELAHALREVGVQMPFIRTRVEGDRVLACLQLTEERGGGNLSLRRICEVTRILADRGFMLTTADRAAAARRLRDDGEEPVSGVHSFIAAE